MRLLDGAGGNAHVGMQLAPDAQQALDFELRSFMEKWLAWVHLEHIRTNVLAQTVAAPEVLGQVVANSTAAEGDSH